MRREGWGRGDREQLTLETLFLLNRLATLDGYSSYLKATLFLRITKAGCFLQVV